MPPLSNIDLETFAAFRRYKAELQQKSKDGKMLTDSEALATLLKEHYKQ